ncbi:hypothetical protein SCP_0705560 [Sparassis crispa]|uniref:Uncharacterized protein n=1 Tax=Sparassis crispa TaxID=139825 RepID=A0A401GT74_9APHY|nr:hypothetical protein SCP_0705560 [Sparassis crispa]GBE85369.1 hypothetical protein SCP_0705560 [Sparassis crispa]
MQPREVDCKWESAARIVDELQFLTLREFKLGVNGKDFAEEEKRHILGCFDALRRRGVDFRLFFDGDLYHSDSPTVSAGQSKTPELHIEDRQLSGVPLTSNDDEHQLSI